MSSASTLVSEDSKPSGRRTGGVTRTVNAGFAHHQAGRLKRAATLYRKALAKDPAHAEALHLLGLIAYQLGEVERAIELIGRALPTLHDMPEVHLNLGNALRAAGRLTEAADSYRRATALDPDYGMAHSNLAGALNDQGGFETGLESARRAVALIPEFLGAHVNCARALLGLGRFAEAEPALRRALALNPGLAEIHNNLGNALQQQNRLDEAVASYERALELRPNFAGAYNNLGNARWVQDRLDDAAASYRRALAVEPDDVNAHISLGQALQAQHHLDEAVASYRRALAITPENALAHYGLGSALQAQHRLDDAVTSYQQATVLDPDFVLAHYSLGLAFYAQGKFEEAIASFRRAEIVDPGNADALAASFHTRKHICDWAGYREDEAKIRNAVGQSPAHATAFMLLALSSTPAEHLDCARGVAAKIAVPETAQLPRLRPRSGGRIRLGYLSADFRLHPVAVLIAELIEHHDRRRFEVVGYPYGRNDGSAMRTRLTGVFDRLVDLGYMPDRQAAGLIHTDAVDILIDLNGYTRGGRPSILAYRPAPIQVNYLGYPGTTGADFIDYIIVDRFLVPMDQQPFYTERLVQLPSCYQPSDTKREIAQPAPSRAACGLPESGFVFCCFNTGYKITPAFFDIWMRLLSAVPGSVLWLVEANTILKGNLQREAMARGVPAGRLVFAPRKPMPEYLARLGLADLFLDTLPYTAGATANDALWAGVPVLTCAGETYVGRMAGSILTAAGLPELITTSLDEYEALALRLTTEPNLLAGLRQRLALNRSTMPLFDIAQYTADLEAAYTQMSETWRAGRSPAAFSVPPPADTRLLRSLAAR
jgi:predicted O-linked N-acetylglucosamine transferase (SPINDLY family)